MKNINLIGISGKMQSGKNTVASIIQYLIYKDKTKNPSLSLDSFLNNTFIGDNYSGFMQKSFAKKLKEIVSILTGIPVEDLEEQEVKNRVLGEEWWYYKGRNGSLIPYSENSKRSSEDLIKMTPRLLLQLLGTDCGRNIIHPNIWITSTFTEYKGDIEIWKNIEGYEGKYQISSFGRVKGLDREIIYGDKSKGEYHTKKESILKPTVTGKYEMIKLEGNNSVTIHSLVTKHFIPKIEGKDFINHIDQNPLNNFYKNLEWCTQSENILDANRKGNGNIGERQSDSKLTNKDVEQIKIYLKTKQFKQKQIAKKFNVSTTTISDIKHGRKWNHVGKDILNINPILPQPLPKWIITDLRFENELEAIKDKNGITIRVNRFMCSKCGNTDNFEGGNNLCNECGHFKSNDKEHESETALDNAEFDYVIDNNGTIEELVVKVKEILIKEHIIR